MPKTVKLSPIPLRVAILCFVVIGVAFLAFRHSQSQQLVPVPDPIRPAYEALKQIDGKALCEMADPAELKKLNITPEKVESILKETFGTSGMPTPIKAELDEPSQHPSDEKVWVLYFSKDYRDLNSIAVTMLDQPNGGSKLNLSWMLWSTCWREQKGAGGVRRYVELAKKYNITGLMSQEGGGYSTVETLEKQARSIEIEAGQR